MFTLVAAISAIAGQPEAGRNDVLQSLRDPGVLADSSLYIPAPAPRVPDGLDKEGQQRALATILKDGPPAKLFYRRSLSSPFVFQFETKMLSGSSRTVRSMDLYFVVYADLTVVADDGAVEDLVGLPASDRAGKAQTLSPKQLAKRGIPTIDGAEQDERYVVGSSELLNRVQLNGVLHVQRTQTKESILAAAVLDPRFTKDDEFPNQWRPLERDESGKLRRGKPLPYEGFGAYLKATRLAQPQGAMLVEVHAVYAEPLEWFDGKDLLRVKLPVLFRDKIRAIRARLRRANRE